MFHQEGNAARRTTRRRGALVVLLATAAFALSGCESILVMTGARMRLDGIPLQSIAASLAGQPALAPGGQAPLSIVATTTDGRTLATAGTGDGKVLADSYRFEASVASVSADGVVSLPADPRLVEGRTPHVRIVAAGTTAPVADLDIPVRYDVPYAATYAGADGLDGASGFDGRAGSDGSMGSFDPASPTAGGNGGDGTDGSDGSDGWNGGDGPDVQVSVALEAGPHPLLRVRASETGHDHYFLVDPQGGSLAIAVRGGQRGAGGKGGAGGRGGSGGAGEPPGFSGNAGRDGRDGQSGRGGAAGQVSVTVDPAAAPWLDRLHVTNESGDGRAGPAPVVTIAPVPPLW